MCEYILDQPTVVFLRPCLLKIKHYYRSTSDEGKNVSIRLLLGRIATSDLPDLPWIVVTSVSSLVEVTVKFMELKMEFGFVIHCFPTISRKYAE